LKVPLAITISDSFVVVVLKHIVEPFYMSKAAENTPGYKEFHEWRVELEQKGVSFHASVEQVPARYDGEHRLAIISARTADNPKLLNGCLDIDCKTIYLEKPGAFRGRTRAD
jgi:hypothetical protein